MGKTHEALEWAETEYHRREMALYRTEFLTEKLHGLAVAPLSLIDRVYEVRKMLEDRTIPIDHLVDRIGQLQREMSRQSEAQFAEFENEADPAEEELLKRLLEIRQIRERAQLICGFVTSMFRPGSVPSDGYAPTAACDSDPDPARRPLGETADPIDSLFEPYDDGDYSSS